jgi:hypothetical protein
MSQLKDERRMKEIFDRGAPYPWDFWKSSEYGLAGQDYETYWQEVIAAAEEEEMGMYCTHYDPQEDC